MNRILIVCSHADDEVLGCGGIISRFVREGKWVGVLCFSTEASGDEIDDARKILEYEYWHTLLYPDNLFDTKPVLNSAELIEDIIGEKKPDTIFTHWHGDLNQDHRHVSHAVRIATRPVPGQVVKRVYEFETLSSSEWGFDGKAFAPNVFFELSGDDYENKRSALESYKSQIREYPHSRSILGIGFLAQIRGAQSGNYFSEAFILVREMK